MELQHDDYSQGGKKKRKKKIFFPVYEVHLIKPNSTYDRLHQGPPKDFTEVSLAFLLKDPSVL